MATPIELDQKAFKALFEALGVCRCKQIADGIGDYTRERHQQLDSLSLDEVWTEIQQRQTPVSRARRTIAL